MRINVIKVGNSKGLRIPKSILEEYRITNSVELKLKDGYIELRPIKKPRENWTKEFKKMVNDPNEENRIPDFFEEDEL